MAPVVIASLPEARAALEAARSSGVAAELESPPDAASIYGVLWFAELNRALAAEFPDVPFTLTLDCGERADFAHAALVEGIKRIRFNGHPEAAKALRDVAEQSGAELAAPAWSDERLYVIAQPDISAADREWIQSIRRQYDPQFAAVDPHFTLVFRAEPSFFAALLARAREVADRIPAFPFDLQSVKVFSDAPPDCYLFLIPDLGSAELVALHEALQVGQAGGLPFVPHMTIGRLASAEKADSLAVELNHARRVIRGRVATLRVLAVAGQKARDLAMIELRGS
jgi:2'-5' RNA ligase